MSCLMSGGETRAARTVRLVRTRGEANDPAASLVRSAEPGSRPAYDLRPDAQERRRADSNRCTRLCRPLPNHSATSPERHRSLAGRSLCTIMSACGSCRPARSPCCSRTSRARRACWRSSVSEYADVLGEHRRVSRDAFSRHGGVEVDTQGDAFFVAFASAAGCGRRGRATLSEALAGRTRPRTDGRPHGRADRHRGGLRRRRRAPRRADHGRRPRRSGARVGDDAAAARPGGGAARPRRPPAEGPRCAGAALPARRRRLPAAEDAATGRTLPIQATPIVGRERELEEARRSRSHASPADPDRAGRQRQDAARDAARGRGNRAVPRRRLLGPASGTPRPGPGRAGDRRGRSARRWPCARLHREQALATSCSTTSSRSCEAAPTVSSLLSETPNTKALVTSREPLQVESEQRYPVEPLPDGDAVALFVERARLWSTDFEPTEPVGEICRRLDGLPLAIELAAARVALLDARTSSSLDSSKRLPLLASRSRDAPVRQRTLRATIEWSYELLEPTEQELFSRLAVFRGGFALEAAESICDADLDVLESLVVKSLVRRLATGRLLTARHDPRVRRRAARSVD